MGSPRRQRHDPCGSLHTESRWACCAGKFLPALTMTGYRSILYGAYMHASSDVCPDPKSRCYTCMRLHLCNRETLGLVTYMYRTVALWRGK